MSDISKRIVENSLVHQISVLRAELATAQRRADNLSKDFDRDVRLYQAELAAERARRESAERDLSGWLEADAMFALARQSAINAEREARATVIKQRDIYQTALSNSVKERAKLREALVKARHAILNVVDFRALFTDIDAVLKETE